LLEGQKIAFFIRNGKTIGAGSELRITENQYVEISKMIANLRAFITKQ